MYNGIGLTTVRGKGTSGHVQGNRAALRGSSRPRRPRGNGGRYNSDKPHNQLRTALKRIGDHGLARRQKSRGILVRLMEEEEKLRTAESRISEKELQVLLGVLKVRLENGEVVGVGWLEEERRELERRKGEVAEEGEVKEAVRPRRRRWRSVGRKEGVRRDWGLGEYEEGVFLERMKRKREGQNGSAMEDGAKSVVEEGDRTEEQGDGSRQADKELREEESNWKDRGISEDDSSSLSESSGIEDSPYRRGDGKPRRKRTRREDSPPRKGLSPQRKTVRRYSSDYINDSSSLSESSGIEGEHQHRLRPSFSRRERRERSPYGRRFRSRSRSRDREYSRSPRYR